MAVKASQKITVKRKKQKVPKGTPIKQCGTCHGTGYVVKR